MFKRNSIFYRVLFPALVVTLLQTILIAIVLFVNGVIKSVDDSAVDVLKKNAENRGLTLENMMLYNWGNLESPEDGFFTVFESYLEKNNLQLSDALGNDKHETQILAEFSDTLIAGLRRSMSTGIYIYFVNDTGDPESQSFNGLYYRDLDPISNPADNSDITVIRGSEGIAKTKGLTLAGSWRERFTIDMGDNAQAGGFMMPLWEAVDNPSLSPADLAYWSSPRSFNTESIINIEDCITYTRPVIYKGKVIAMLGTEVQLKYLQSFFPFSDYGDSGMGGYVLIRYDKNTSGYEIIDCEVLTMTGRNISNQLAPYNRVSIVKTSREGVYKFLGSKEGVQAARKELGLYSANSPYSNEQWALVSAGTDNLLFNTSRRMRLGIIYSTAISFAAGFILLSFFVRVSVKPLITLAEKIRNSDLSDTIVNEKPYTYETELLCGTINALKDRRLEMENQLRAERERYLMALESAGDTFMEYDIERDFFMLYYFSADSQKPELLYKTVEGFRKRVYEGSICHVDDINKVRSFFKGELSGSIEIRVPVQLFTHITDTVPDNGYYWVRLKASHVYSSDNEIKKVIGTARQITEDKRREHEVLEATRRDITTGFYNKDYGLLLVEEYTDKTINPNATFTVCVIHVNRFDLFEAYYGRVFGGIIMMKISRCISGVMREGDVAVRLNNDEFVVYFQNTDEEEAKERLQKISNKLSVMYTGENSEMILRISVGAACQSDNEAGLAAHEIAYRAASFAARANVQNPVFYAEMQSDMLREEAVQERDNPVSVFLDISEANIVGLAFDLFERTSDTHSVINMLLTVIGSIFNLSSVTICEFDASFGSNQISYYWDITGVAPRHGNIEKILSSDIVELEAMLDENRVRLFRSGMLDSLSQGVKQLLCVNPDEYCGILCIAMYENDIQTGRMLFKFSEYETELTFEKIYALFEITKIISARISIEKSNSASRAKSEFLSRVSHEIRTPMNAIIGMTGIAKDAQDDTAAVQDCLEKIDFSAKHLLALINDVLDMSRIESGRLELQNEPFSLQNFAAAIDTLLRPQIEGKGVKFTLDVNCGNISVIGDEYRLRQVIVNFLGNAVKFTEKGGEISFTIEQLRVKENSRAAYRFSVRDTGIGIAKDEQKFIFDAFTQASSAKHGQNVQKGTGLGLAICSRIIGAMGSVIELESEIMEGSVFSFVLEMDQADNDQVSEEVITEEAVGMSFAGKTVLLVEDNDINMEIACYILEKVGLVIDVARDGAEAVEKFSASEVGYYSAILMDIQMPVMDGLTATREIRRIASRPDSRKIPIIAMTANAFDEDMKQSIESGMNGHIAKPIDNDLLYSLLSQLIT